MLFHDAFRMVASALFERVKFRQVISVKLLMFLLFVNILTWTKYTNLYFI